MTFAVNILDEPRVSAPLDTLNRALQHPSTRKQPANGPQSSAALTQEEAEIDFLKVGRQRAWEEMISACSVESPARSASGTKRGERVLQFIANATNSLDVCLQPSLHKMHGFLLSPDSLDMTHSLVPLLSQGKPSILNDVLFRSPYYAG
jgi:hypothetical protein